MEKAFEIDVIRQIITQTLLEEYIKQPSKYIGNENDVRLTSFYEHLASDDEVNRYVETVRDLINQQNRTGLIANGTILSPENPTITNINQCLIIPLVFTINFRCTLANRDLVKQTMENMIRTLKGRKVDVAEFESGKLFKVGTLGNNSIGAPLIRNGDYIGEFDSTNFTGQNNAIQTRINTLKSLGFVFPVEESHLNHCYFYFTDISDNKLYVAYGTWTTNTEVIPNVSWWNFAKILDDGESYPNIIFPPEYSLFNKYCVSMSFDSFRCSEPRTLNDGDYCDLSFGGSATIVSEGVMLGNQLTKVGIKRYKVIKSDNGSQDTTFADNYSWLEPLEMPSGNNADTQLNQLVKNNFVNNTHSNSISITNQYTFIIDEDIVFIKNLFKYARYGKQDYFTPNIIFSVQEMFSKWGEVDIYEYKAKIVESIDIENTESDTLTISIPLQIQGEYN